MFNDKKKIRPITLFTQTNVGKERDNNEDSVASLVLNANSSKKEFDCGILVVADGMGGHEMGEVASDIAVKTFVEKVLHNILHSSKDKSKIDFSEILEKSVIAANKEVINMAGGKSNRMGTTLVGAIIFDNRAYIANVGDSRAYLVKSKKSLIQITKDHSAVQAMLDANIITKEQAKNHPRKHIITKSLGLNEEIRPDIFEQNLDDGVLLLCSDGLFNMVDDEDIIQAVNGNIYNTAEDLITLANKHGGLDNISVGLASYNS
jgi:serine/threonine protein phosphatase PrpC